MARYHACGTAVGRMLASLWSSLPGKPLVTDAQIELDMCECLDAVVLLSPFLLHSSNVFLLVRWRNLEVDFWASVSFGSPRTLCDSCGWGFLLYLILYLALPLATVLFAKQGWEAATGRD